MNVATVPIPLAERVEADVDAALSAADHAGGLLAELERTGGTEDAGHCGPESRSAYLSMYTAVRYSIGSPPKTT